MTHESFNMVPYVFVNSCTSMEMVLGHIQANIFSLHITDYNEGSMDQVDQNTKKLVSK